MQYLSCRNGLRQLLFVFLVHCTCFCAAQQPFRFEHFTSENGLTENVVYSLFQDSKGYLWIGTHDGLNRYDGYRFQQYRHDPKNKHSLPSNTINSICEDASGYMWLATAEGLCRFNPVTGIFEKLPLPVQRKNVEQVLAAGANTLLVRCWQSILRVDTRSLQAYPVMAMENAEAFGSGNPFSILSKNKSGTIVTSKTDNGRLMVWSFDMKKNKFSTKACFGLTASWAKRQVLDCHLDTKNNLWLTVMGAAPLRLQPEAGKFETLHLNKVPYIAYDIVEDSRQNVWIATNDGLLLYTAAADNPQRFSSATVTGISSDYVQTVFEDQTGLVWIGTNNGLNKLNPLQKHFTHLTTAKNTALPLFNNFILGLYPEGENVVRIHYNDARKVFSRLDTRQRTIRHISFDHYDSTRFVKEVLASGAPAFKNFLVQKAIKYLHGINADIRSGWLFADRNKSLWFCNWNSLFQLGTANLWTLPALITEANLEKDEIWLGTNGEGLICLDVRTKKLTRFQVNNTRNHTLSSNDITCFLFEPDGNMWIGTKGGGLNYFNRKTQLFYTLTEDDGLCNNSIYCMVKDSRNRLWIGTTYGLSCYDPNTKTFRNFFPSDGLINAEFNRYSACRLADGSLLMGGINGIDRFHPDSLLGNKTKPRVQISEVRLFNQPLHHATDIKLAHDQNHLTFEFAAMDFTLPAGNKFMYRLEGADEKWLSAGTRNIATYALLPPGRYNFLVKASNSDGDWSESPANFRFTILPAWHQTWWFYAVSALAFAALVYLFFRLRMQQQIRLLQLRNQLHRDLHDDVGATLSSIKAYSEILGKNGNQEIITKLIRENAAEMIDRLEVISWATNPQHDNAKSLVSTMLKLAHPVMHVHGITLQFEKSGLDENMAIPGTVRQHLLLIFKEAVNNIIKYAEATQCEVKLGLQYHKLLLEIKDNGKGFDGSKTGAGNGLKNMLKRAQELRGTVETISAPGLGTKVQITVPHPFKSPALWFGRQKTK